MQRFRVFGKKSVVLIGSLCCVLCASGATHALSVEQSASNVRTVQPQRRSSNVPNSQSASTSEIAEAPRTSVDPSGVDPVTGIPYYEEIREDWSSLSVGASELHTEPPLVTLPDEAGTFTRTLVSLKWRPGDALDVYVILPKGVKNPPAVLYLYNYTDDTDRFKNDGWCRRVTGGGFAAIGFVSALSGHRFHDRPMKQWFVSELQESLGSTVHDVKFILDYLASRGDIDMNRIGMFGQGSGATIALLAAAADSRIIAVDALDPWGDWPVWLAKSAVGADDPERTERLKPAFLKQVAPLDPVQWLPKVHAPYIRIQQNLEDQATPRVCKNRIRAAAPKRVVFERFDTTAAFMNGEGGGRLFDWIKDAVAKPIVQPALRNTTVASGSSARTSTKRPVHQ